MNVDVLFSGNVFLDQELSNLATLITRKLKHLSKVFVNNNFAIARQLLFQHLQDLASVKLLLESLHNSPRLSPIALLYSNVYVMSVSISTVQEV